MTLITEAEKTAFRTTAGEIFTALNSVSWKTLTACECIDEYGIADPECEECGGDGVTESSKSIAADVQEITGDERVAVEAGILKRGDLVIRTLTTNQVKVGDIINRNFERFFSYRAKTPYGLGGWIIPSQRPLCQNPQLHQ